VKRMWQFVRAVFSIWASRSNWWSESAPLAIAELVDKDGRCGDRPSSILWV